MLGGGLSGFEGQSCDHGHALAFSGPQLPQLETETVTIWPQHPGQGGHED